MIRAILLLLALSGCSGVKTVCDKRGDCLETWRNVSAVSSVTYSQMRSHSGALVAGTSSITNGSGVVGYVDPFASDATTIAAGAKDVGAW